MHSNAQQQYGTRGSLRGVGEGNRKVHRTHTVECSHVHTVFLNPGFKWGIDSIYLCGFGGLYVSMSDE